MATKSYTKHKEFKEFSSNKTFGSDEQFDMIKSELLPKNSKLRSLTPTGSDAEYHYEYHEDRHPAGTYQRKDLHTVEQYTIPAKSTSEHSSYYYTKEDKSVPAVNSSNHFEHSVTSSSPGYSRIKSSKKELSHNVEELDSLLDDLQRDQQRQTYKSGYTSDAADSSSYEYRKTTSTPIKTSAPSSGYSTLKTERSDNWTSSPLQPTTVKQSEFTKEMFREEKTESRVVPSQISPAISHPVPAPVCHQCQFPSSTLHSAPGNGMNKVTTTVKTYTYEVPASQAVSEVSRYVADSRLDSSTTSAPVQCQYCSHCSSRITQHDSSSTRVIPPAPVTASLSREHREHHVESTHTENFPRSERVVYPKPANDVRTPVNFTDSPAVPAGPGGPATYKWSETSYSAYNTTERRPLDSPPAAPFPRPVTPAPAAQQPPKKLDDLLAEFPETQRFPTNEGLTQRKVEVVHETKRETPSKNMAGPAVYYPPGHTPFQKKEAAYSYGQASAEGGKWAAGRGMYEYEAGSKSKEKSSESKKVVPLCLPVCCAMPCSIM